VRYPRPVEDVLCAVAAAVDGARARGFDPAPVAVLGHSSGAHLAALAVLADADPSPRCDSPPVTPDALIGLSGPYDITRTPDAARALLGSDPDEDPRAWAAANPVGRAGLRADVPVLLLHGGSDDVVPVSFTYQFAAALRGAGHPTTVEVVAGIDHQGIYRADVAGERVARWLLGLSGDGPTAPARRRRAGR
jgi:acetyl esterase/lipase